MYFKPQQFSSKSSQAHFYGTTMCVQCIIVFRLANLQTQLKRTIKMRFLATTPIFSFVNIFIGLKICSCLWMISLFLKRFSTDMECSEMYICTIWSDVQFPVDPLTAEGRLRHNNMDVCLFVRRCSNGWINTMPCITHVWYLELGDHPIYWDWSLLGWRSHQYRLVSLLLFCVFNNWSQDNHHCDNSPLNIQENWF